MDDQEDESINQTEFITDIIIVLFSINNSGFIFRNNNLHLSSIFDDNEYKAIDKKKNIIIKIPKSDGTYLEKEISQSNITEFIKFN